MSRRTQKTDESGVKKIAEYELDVEYSGRTITDTKRKGVRITPKITTEERNLRYFRAPVFTAYRAEIVRFLNEEPIVLALLPQNDWLAPQITELILQNFNQLRQNGKKLVPSKSISSTASRAYQRALEDIEDDLIDYIEDLLTTNLQRIERKEVSAFDILADYESFADAIATLFLEKYYAGSKTKNDVYEKILIFLDDNSQTIDLADEELVLEIVDYLKQMMEKEDVEVDFDYVQDLLYKVQIVYQRYGKEGFPWQLSTISEIAGDYLRKSDLSKILRRGIKEKTPCPINNCGGMESTTYLLDVRSTDEGKVEKRFCVRCGNKRR